MGVKEQLQDLEDKLTKGLEITYERMIAFKKAKQSPIVYSKDGQVLEINAEQSDKQKNA